MTIYKPKKLKEAEKLKSVSLLIDKQDLLLKTKGDVEIKPFDKRKRPLLLASCVVFILFVVALLCLGVGVVIYKHSLEKRAFCGTMDFELHHHERKMRQRFRETVEIDGLHEKLEIPKILSYRDSVVLHDFGKNMTAIVDQLNARCYLMPLNRSAIEPPKSYIDLIKKVEAGYYAITVEMLRENFSVDVGTLPRPEEYGDYIEQYCGYYDIYKLRKIPKGRIAKRFAEPSVACPMKGDKFCLGETSSKQMSCITLVTCF